ncbi:MAG: hypothetical protein LH606_20080 [Cytophagaceae bacterium]|nr:hypothetical protein [Cytophagaceae bacterium]
MKKVVYEYTCGQGWLRDQGGNTTGYYWIWCDSNNNSPTRIEVYMFE